MGDPKTVDAQAWVAARKAEDAATRCEETDRKEAWREYEIGRRKMDLITATHQHPPPGWKDDLLSPVYLPPPGDHWPPGTVERTGRIRVVYDRDKERG